MLIYIQIEKFDKCTSIHFLSVLQKQIKKPPKKCIGADIFFWIYQCFFLKFRTSCRILYMYTYSNPRILPDLCHTLIRKRGVTYGWDARLSPNVSRTESPQSKIRAVHAIGIQNPRRDTQNHDVYNQTHDNQRKRQICYLCCPHQHLSFLVKWIGGGRAVFCHVVMTQMIITSRI